MRHDRDFNPGTRRPAQAPQGRRFGRAGGQPRQRQLVVGPGKPAGRIKQPIAGSIANPNPYRAGRKQRLAVAFCAERRRRERRGVTNGDSGEILMAWKRCIGLGADEKTVRQQVIVSPLEPPEETPRLVKVVDRLSKVERAGDARHGRPI